MPLSPIQSSFYLKYILNDQTRELWQETTRLLIIHDNVIKSFFIKLNQMRWIEYGAGSELLTASNELAVLLTMIHVRMDSL